MPVNLSTTKVKSIPVLTVKIGQDLLAYLLKVKQRKPVLIALKQSRPEVLIVVNLALLSLKMLALEIAAVTLLGVLGEANKFADFKLNNKYMDKRLVN